ncbi:hypothetical protein SO802_009782 [Lithocarpus litseifolius]|uniref:Uncharacterized protein n=1 Tax=Lithocarpus litseifolius TaxID=425828 RepID=A0AAW2DCE8_9ROSI
MLWSVYIYGPDDFAHVGRNTNVTGYPFPEGTWALELTEYSQQLYGARDEEDDDGGDGAGGSKSTSSHHLRKRFFQ